MPERAFKGAFPSNINTLQSGPTGTDFTGLGQSRAKRSDPCVREFEQEKIKRHMHAYFLTNTHTYSLWRALGIDYIV